MRQTHISNNQSNNGLHTSKSKDIDREAFNNSDIRAINLDSITPSGINQTTHKKKISLKNYLKQST